MLLEFSFKNFRSFKDEAVFSMLPVNSYKEQQENIHPQNIPGTGTDGVLTAAAIYGPNASGKTNLLRAVHFSRNLILGIVHPAHLARRQSFVGNTSPTSFSYTFYTDGTRYEYEFALDDDGALSETLSVSPKAKRLVYERSRNDDGTYSVKQGSKYTGISTKLKGYTDPGLVLGMLANYGIDPCVKAMRWFADNLVIANREAPITDAELMDKLAALSEAKFKKVIRAISSADLGITGVQLKVDDMTENEKTVQKENASKLAAVFEALTGQKPNGVEIPDKKVAMQFRHEIDGRSVGFGLDDESLGTRTMLDLAVDFIDAIDAGRTLFVDEIERSLHPMPLESLVALFFDPGLNEHGAQLVFTTNELLFLKNDGLRRDQIWFIEKDPQSGSSDIYPLFSFSPRKDESLINRYLHGAYGAVPYVDRLMGSICDAGEVIF